MADEDTYNLEVYREQDTGKIRIKGQTRITPITNSPTTEQDQKINDIIELLTRLGPNPEA